MTIVLALFGDTKPDHLGLIPAFLDDNDPRPAKEQFHENYAHGGGWRPMSKMTMDKTGALHYPGDPEYEPIAAIRMRSETIYVYRWGIVAIRQKDGSFEVARMD